MQIEKNQGWESRQRKVYQAQNPVESDSTLVRWIQAPKRFFSNPQPRQKFVASRLKKRILLLRHLRPPVRQNQERETV